MENKSKPATPEKSVESSQNHDPGGIQQIREIILGEQIISWNHKISQLEDKLDKLNATINSKVTELNKKISSNQKSVSEHLESTNKEMQQSAKDIQKLLAEFKKEVEQNLQKLHENKVDRDSIGEVFIQWGQKVKNR
jgi:DNA anti-recombination protein RmuC